MMQSRDYDVLMFFPSGIEPHITIKMGEWLDELFFNHREQNITTIVVDFEIVKTQRVDTMEIIELRGSQDGQKVMYLLNPNQEDEEVTEFSTTRTVRWV